MSTYMVEHRDSRNAPRQLNETIMLLWTDPPYGTGKTQSQTDHSYTDTTNPEYVLQALSQWEPLMDTDGTVCVCLDYRFAYRVIAHMTSTLGWEFRGEIIWEFGLGRPRLAWWPVRHNNILTFTRTPTSGHFDSSAIPIAKRLAPKKGYADTKPSGSVWEYTMSNTHPERVGYPNQKPIALIEPFVLAHTRPGDLVADIFCGSSSTGVAALRNGRRYYGCDSNPEAHYASHERLATAVAKGWPTFDSAWPNRAGGTR